MDDKTLSALTLLAAKLGTTAEYLWGVLLKQAPISAATNLTMIAIWAVCAVLLVRLVRRKTTPPQATAEDKYPSAEWDGDATVFAWGAATILVAVGLAVTLDKSTMIIAALFNPEYWALHQILKP